MNASACSGQRVAQLPLEAVLLAMTVQLGRIAGELLAQSGLGSAAGVGRPQGEDPVARLQSLLEQVDSHFRKGRKAGATRSPGSGADGLAPDGGGGRGLHEQRVEAARALMAYWAEQLPPPTLNRYGEEIDVRCATGRWELLALAVLMGAPVARFRVEEAFCQLRRQGLLEMGRVAAASAEWAASVDHTLERVYRGPVNRVRQRERLARAAQVLAEEFSGDLDGVWERAGRDPGRCRELLRAHFEGVDRMAAWLMREMGRLGAWKGANQHPAAFYPDEYVRQVLQNLGMVPDRASVRETRSLVERYFAGDTTALLHHGKERCSRRSVAVCLKHCPVSHFCAAWRRWANGPDGDSWPAGDGGAGPNRETPAKRSAGARQVHVEPAGGAAIL